MAGIAGVARRGEHKLVNRMLNKIAYRGPEEHTIINGTNTTLGLTCNNLQGAEVNHLKQTLTACDEGGDDHYVRIKDDPFFIERDPLGVAPLYYGLTKDRVLCFASEVKGLLEVTRDVHELPPGNSFDGKLMKPYYTVHKQSYIKESPERIAQELRRRLEIAVEKRSGNQKMGAWLSGGLDSSALAALASRHFHPLHTFSAGLPGSADIKYAQLVSEFIGSKHHSVTVGLEDMLAILPKVIYHLESFDAWLVRSSILNYLVSRLAADYVPAVFSGEGGDELFAGYAYLQSLNPSALPDELIDITLQLHNTALQRVDRCASAFGTFAHVVFLDLDILEYALRIPVEYKLNKGVEKWILRQAVADVLPPSVIKRRKAKFWEGAGVQDRLAQFADAHISDNDFTRERKLPNGWRLNSKEELYYYRIFREHFGDFDDLSWMGRTSGVPIQ
jgi:asparagine synthase (glutamine-hydrolysing)